MLACFSSVCLLAYHADRGDGGAVSQKEFGSLVHKVIRGRVDPEEVDLLYRIYDRNADGAIWVGEPFCCFPCRLHESRLYIESTDVAFVSAIWFVSSCPRWAALPWIPVALSCESKQVCA